MRKPLNASFWIKATQALLLALAVTFSVNATDSSARFNNLNHRLMCTCGCAQVLGECDHYGCPGRTPEMAELRSFIQAGLSDKDILNAFAAKYGMSVLAAPPKSGFNLVAWIAPFAVLAAGLLGTILLVRRWSFGRVKAAAEAAAAANPELNALRDKIRRETGAEGDL